MLLKDTSACLLNKSVKYVDQFGISKQTMDKKKIINNHDT